MFWVGEEPEERIGTVKWASLSCGGGSAGMN